MIYFISNLNFFSCTSKLFHIKFIVLISIRTAIIINLFIKYLFLRNLIFIYNFINVLIQNQNLKSNIFLIKIY